MQQLQAVDTTGFAQHLNQLQNLCGCQAKFRFLAARGLPFARTLRCQTRTHAKARYYIQALSFFQHNANFRHLLDDQIDLVAHLLADQRQADVFTVFIAITHND
ncbi:hypothetical protein D3C75_685250 [compost metagenome]